MITDKILIGAYYQIIKKDVRDTDLGKMKDHNVPSSGYIVTIYIDIEYLVTIKVTNMLYNHIKTYRDVETIKTVLFSLIESKKNMNKEWLINYNKIFLKYMYD